MARQIVNIGATANDNTGDTLRQGGSKINANFSELYSFLGGDSATLGVTSQLTDSGVTFFGNTYDTKLGFVEGNSNVLINLPDSSGNVVVTTARQTLTQKTLTSPIITSPAISTLKLNDNDSSHQYTIVTGALTANHKINIPSLSDSDAFVLTKTTQTLTNKTLTTPTISEPKITIAIDDSNGNEMIRFTSTASAVNEVQVQNAATGSGPTISVAGNDTNVNLNFSSKGTGAVRVQTKVAYSAETLVSNGAVSLLVPLTIFNSSGSLSMTLANGTVVGESKKLININSGAATVTPTSFGQGTSFTLKQNGAAETIWAGSNWYLFGDSNVNYLTIT